MQQERPLERGRRTLEGLPEYGDEDSPAIEVGQRIAQPLGAGDGVVLEAAHLETGRCVHVVVGAHGHDEEVRVVDTGVRGDPPGGGVEAGHRLLAEIDAVLVDLAVVQSHVVGRSPAEHHVELGVAEDERVVAVQQRDADRVLERLGEPGRQLQATEAGPEDQDVFLHRARNPIPFPATLVCAPRPPDCPDRVADRRCSGGQAQRSGGATYAHRRTGILPPETEVRSEGIQVWRARPWVLGYLPGGVR